MNKYRYQIVSVVISLLVYSFCAYTSPLFFFSGSTFFFNVAKAMVNGAVLYKDILEQKGLLIYVLYMPAYLISHTDFIGVWIIHLILVTINSWLAFLIFRELKFSPATCAVSVVLYSIVVYRHCTSLAVEFDLLPCFLFSIWTLVRADKNNFTAKDLLINGMLGGIVLWTKYSLLSFYLGYVFCIVLFCIFNKKTREAISAVLYFGFGMLTISIPCLFYFISGNAVEELLKYYFLNNIIDYGYGKIDSIKNFIINYFIDVPIWNIRWNPVLIAILIFSIISLFFLKIDVWKKMILFFTLSLQYLGVFFHGPMFNYYLHSFVCFGVFGVAAGVAAMECVATRVKKITGKRIMDYTTVLITGVFIMLLIISELPGKINAAQNYKNSMQYIFSEYILHSGNELTMLDFGILDYGVGIKEDIVPSTWAYCKLNWNNPKMDDDQMNAIKNRSTAFVVTADSIQIPRELKKNYQLVKSYKESEDTFYLFERKTAEYSDGKK